MQVIRIMVAEDEAITREGLVNGIDWAGHGIQVVGSAENGMEALLMAQELGPDLILSDVHMPVMDGLELIERLSQEMPSVKVIIISGYQEFEYAKKAMAYGVQDYLLKPLDEAELVERILQVGRKLEADRNSELKRNLDYLLLSEESGFAQAYQRLEKDLTVHFERMQVPEALEVLQQIHKLFATREDLRYYRAASLRQLVRFREIMEKWGLGQEAANIDAMMVNELGRLSSSGDILRWQAQKIKEFINMARIHTGSKSSKLVHEVEAHVAEHFAEDISLAGISARVFISPQYLSRLFRSEKGVSFIEWLNAFRIEKAKDYLSATDARITDVAGLVGYNDYKYFSNVFKKYTGVTPRDYRKRQV